MLGFSPLAASPIGDDGAVLFTGDALTSISIITDATTITASSVAQKHLIDSISLATDTTSVTSTDILSVHVIASTNITTSIEISTSTITQDQILSSTDISSGDIYVSQSAVGLIAGTDVLTSTAIVTGSISISSPSATITHALISTSITATPNISTSTLVTSHTLSATDIASGAVSINTVVAGVTHNLVSSGIDVTPTISSATLTVNNGIIAANITSVAPSVSNASMYQINQFVATDIVLEPVDATSPYMYILGEFRDDYSRKRTYIVTDESRTVVIPRPPMSTTKYVLSDNRNMRMQ